MTQIFLINKVYIRWWYAGPLQLSAYCWTCDCQTTRELCSWHHWLSDYSSMQKTKSFCDLEDATRQQDCNSLGDVWFDEELSICVIIFPVYHRRATFISADCVLCADNLVKTQLQEWSQHWYCWGLTTAMPFLSVYQQRSHSHYRE